MKHLLESGQMTREIPFLGGFVDVRKTTVKDLKDIQAVAKSVDFNKDSEETMQFVYDTLRRFVIGAEDMADSEFEEFPVEDLGELIEEILGKKTGNE